MKKMILPQLFIYDLDGTLIDSVPNISKAINLALQEVFSVEASIDEVRTWVGNGSLKLAARALNYAQEPSNKSLVNEKALANLHQRFLHYYGRDIHRPNPVFEGVHELLRLVHKTGTPQAVATNKPQQFVPSLLKNEGLTPYISAIVGGNSLPERKPHPLPLEYLCRRFHCQPDKAIMIGDSESDAISAKKAGIPCWLVEQGYAQGIDLQQLGALEVFKDMQKLLGYTQTLIHKP